VIFGFLWVGNFTYGGFPLYVGRYGRLAIEHVLKEKL
jgi:hypothetical protein